MDKLNIEQLVAVLGGRSIVAGLCDITAGAVLKWELANEVPSKHWTAIVKATKRGITYDMLEGPVS